MQNLSVTQIGHMWASSDIESHPEISLRAEASAALETRPIKSKMRTAEPIIRKGTFGHDIYLHTGSSFVQPSPRLLLVVIRMLRNEKDPNLFIHSPPF